MNQIRLDTKIFIPLNMTQIILKKIFLFSVVIFVFITLLQFRMDGFQLSKFIELLLVCFIGFVLYTWVGNGYQEVGANCEIDDSSYNITYKNVACNGTRKDLIISVPIESISRIEFSDKLKAIRVFGKVSKRFAGETTVNLDEWVLYVKEDSSVLRKLEEVSAQSVVYMDR